MKKSPVIGVLNTQCLDLLQRCPVNNLNCIWWRGSGSELLVSVEYPYNRADWGYGV